MAKLPLYMVIARTLLAIRNCQASNNTEWEARHTERLDRLVREYLPSGSGFDSGCKVKSVGINGRFIVLAPFHCMNSDGFYTGWEDYRIHVYPHLAFGFDIGCLEGKDRDGTLEYVLDTVHECLSAEVSEYASE